MDFSHHQQSQSPSDRRPSISSLSSASVSISGYTSDKEFNPSSKDKSITTNASITAMHPNTTGNSLLSSRVSQSRHFGSTTPTTQNASTALYNANGNGNLIGSNTHLPSSSNGTPVPQQQHNSLQQLLPHHSSTAGTAGSNSTSTNFNPNWLPQQTNPMLNVTPWIEQQAQVAPPSINLAQSLSMTNDSNDQQQSQQQQQNSVSNSGGDGNTSGTHPTNLGGLLAASKGGMSMNPASTVNSVTGSLMTVNDTNSNHATVNSPQFHLHSGSNNLGVATGSSDGKQHSIKSSPDINAHVEKQINENELSNDSNINDIHENSSRFNNNSNNNQNQLNPHNSLTHSHNSHGHSRSRSHGQSQNKEDEEVIPTAIVIKNIPFAIKKEQLLDVMSKLNLPLPYAFNYHFDNGVFRGLAFANFNSTDETNMVVSILNGREIGGRKLRVETTS
ncbi:unnamed protein product [Ambrosiozyma monospora]|uniref:Unnamed protein product n=1 Tax=Ambrosiozyma monospora TaxID=43982 RepID=A0ACB5SW48_AMBMO|nr:unnamed protein product [Ambrosiozyma monospora]